MARRVCAAALILAAAAAERQGPHAHGVGTQYAERYDLCGERVCAAGAPGEGAHAGA